jgi:alkylhydroperoxidase family enzyme
MGKVYKHLIAANRVLVESTLPVAVQELVKLRASQINGCGYCVASPPEATAPGRPTPSDRPFVRPGEPL